MTPPRDKELEDRLAWIDDEHGNQAAMDWLVEHADRARPFIRSRVENEADGLGFGRAVGVLGRMSQEEDVPLLVAKLEGTFDSNVSDILHALSQHRTEAAYEAMVELTTARRPLVAQQALVWLGARGDERARPTLEGFLEHEDSSLRWAAVRGLAELGAEPSRAKLKARRKVEKDREVKAEIDKALK